MAKMISYLRQKVGPSVMEKARVSSLSLGHPTTVSLRLLHAQNSVEGGKEVTSTIVQWAA